MAHRPIGTARRSRTNYTALLRELQGHKTDGPETAAVRSPPPKTPPPAPLPDPGFRHRLLSNEAVRYFYSQTDGVLHDKTCRLARQIPDEKLCWSGSYRPDLVQCPDCRLKAYLRLGARDACRAAAYEPLFEAMGFSEELLRRMYVEQGIRTEIVGPGWLKLWGREDTWLLEPAPDGKALRLMHNNYRAQPDGSRRFAPGFHEQAASVTAQVAVSMITRYSYEKHKANMAVWKAHRAGDTPHKAVRQRPGIWRRLWDRLRALFGKRQ